MEPKSQIPNVYEYDNYREFLKDYYSYRKGLKKSFSYRYFSRMAGFQSPNVLKRVMEGERNLTKDSIKKFSKALSFDFDQAQFYKNLVGFNQAKNFGEKEKYAQKISSSKAYNKIKPKAKIQYEYWSNWYNVAIRELVEVKGFQEDPEWIANFLNPSITPEEAKNSLKHLQELGFLKRNEEGKLVQTQNHIDLADGVLSASISQFHRDMIAKARESLDRFEKTERYVSNMTFTASHRDMEEIKFMMQEFNKKLMEKIKQCHKGTGVFQVNFQAFPLTQLPEDNYQYEN